MRRVALRDTDWPSRVSEGKGKEKETREVFLVNHAEAVLARTYE